jgi:hypothetical protein
MFMLEKITHSTNYSWVQKNMFMDSKMTLVSKNIHGSRKSVHVFGKLFTCIKNVH